MNGRSVISLFLLLTYFVGFAQGITPSCNHDSIIETTDSEERHHHEHHQHADNVNMKDNHVLHNDHFDSSQLDMLLCVLEDVSHSDEDGCNCLPIIANRNNSISVFKLKLLAVVVPILYNVDQHEVPTYCISTTIGELNSPLLSSSPDRGPPTIS